MTDAHAPLLGVRVDVDTHEGLRDGVPRLLDLLRDAGVHATFYLAMGPDRSGLAVLNLLRPGFLAKMYRTGAVRVYGLRTILSGTLLPARLVGAALPEIGRRARAEGHETGVHGWDHRLWQDRLLGLSAARVAEQLDRGFSGYEAALGERPSTFAAPAWLTSEAALLHQETYRLRYASDCRGREPFLPVVGGSALVTPQVPATLPTLDEALGFSHESAGDYFESMLERARGEAWPVLTVHAELEGGPYAEDFAQFLDRVPSRGVRCVPLGSLLEARLAAGPLPACPVLHAPVPGRHGVVAVQGAAGCECGLREKVTR